MRLVLERLQLNNGCTIGSLSINGNHECWTLEDTVRTGPKVKGQTGSREARIRLKQTGEILAGFGVSREDIA